MSQVPLLGEAGGSLSLERIWAIPPNKQKERMHYKNGKEAKAGDKVIDLESGRVGILHSPSPSATSCNAQIVPLEDSYYVTVGECVRLDDAIAAMKIPQTAPAKIPGNL